MDEPSDRCYPVPGSKHKINVTDFMPGQIIHANHPRVQQFIGKKFGRLTAVRFVEMRRWASGTRQFWEFNCECGNRLIASRNNVEKGNTTSCGCFKKEIITAGVGLKHGFARRQNRHHLYSCWKAMHQRCNNPNAQNYHWYGAKNVKVCRRWDNFENFLADMESDWKPGLTLDRYPDPSGNYEPSNCRWATKKQQANNRRTS